MNDSYQAEILLKLVKEHKEACGSSECNISLFALFPIYESLVGKVKAKRQLKNFM